MTRIDSRISAELANGQIQKLNAELDRLQRQVATGKKAERYGDLGIAAKTVIDLMNEISTLRSHESTVETLKLRTEIIDTTLVAIRDETLKARDAALEVKSKAATPSDLKTLATTALHSITSKLQIDISGRYLFSGVMLDTPPMVPSATLLASVQAAIDAALAAPVPDAATAVGAAIDGIFSTPANYYAGGGATPPTRIGGSETLSYGMTGDNPAFRDVLQGLYTLATLPTPKPAPATPPDIDEAQYQAILDGALGKIEAGLEGVGTLVASNGVAGARLEAVAEEHKTARLLLETEFNALTEADLAEVSARLSDVQTRLQALYAITAQLRDLSLVNFLT